MSNTSITFNKSALFLTGPDGAVAKLSVSGLIGTGSHHSTGSNPEQVFIDPVGRCKATKPSSLSLKKKTLLIHCPG